MELSEKIQQLRKQQNLTQEQLAEKLFVSRTAVSKWETGRGTPGIESLQAMAKCFQVTLDVLLSTEELVAVAETENRETLRRFALDVDGAINLAALLGPFLPLYKLAEADGFRSVPLYRLDGWQAALFWALPLAMMLCGALQLWLGRREAGKYSTLFSGAGMLFHVLNVCLLILSGQPYPAVLYLALLLGKGWILIKKRR